MLEEARQEIDKKATQFAESVKLCHEQLDQQRATWLLVCQWVAHHFDKRAESPRVRALPTEYDYNYGNIAFEFVLRNGEAWNEILGLLELLETRGVPINSWTSSEDAKNFTRTYTADVRTPSGVDITWRIVLALREGNLGGCRRVHVGKETISTPTIRDRYVLICDDPPE